TTTAIAVNASASREGVDPLTQLTPIAIAASTPTIFTAHGSVASQDLMDFVRNAKGGRFTYSSAGIGTTQHLTGEYLFRSVPGLDATHVPFQGGTQVNTAVVAGEVDVADRKSTRLNFSHLGISYAVFCLKKKKRSTY